MLYIRTPLGDRGESRIRAERVPLNRELNEAATVPPNSSQPPILHRVAMAQLQRPKRSSAPLHERCNTCGRKGEHEWLEEVPACMWERRERGLPASVKPCWAPRTSSASRQLQCFPNATSETSLSRLHHGIKSAVSLLPICQPQHTGDQDPSSLYQALYLKTSYVHIWQ